MQIAPAQATDVEEATDCLVSAFARDPLIDYFLFGLPEPRDEARRTFFSLLLRARLAMAAPVLVARDGGRLVGAAMGYGANRPDWPEALERAWEAFEAGVPGMNERSEHYAAIKKAGLPPAPHYYLGVLGVAPGRQGQGLGQALLESFCALSAADPASAGVYLETATPANLPLYRRAGFTPTHSAPLGMGMLWCMYCKHERSLMR